MSSQAERFFDDAVRTGRKNAVTMEMARRHCLNMTFTEFGGQGMAEAATGLPINTRQVSCLVAHGGASANLDWIVGEFYEQHCVGCSHRRPTGDVPNLATVMDERKEAAARAEEAERAETAKRPEGARMRINLIAAPAGALAAIGMRLQAGPAAAFGPAQSSSSEQRLLCGGRRAG
ncbi:hypothetical protein, partial [Streptomyces nogalater]|uniref:hypothetical protein n=1 Tax=Streptomyces nogalater TaxID=38314 RepID=UPI0031D6FD18